MTENQCEKFKSKRKVISIDKTQGANNAPENVDSGKTLGFVNLKDFPELRTSSGSQENVTHSHRNSESAHRNKSWLSVVNKRKENNFKEAFPALPGLEESQKNGNDLKFKKDDGKSQLLLDNTGKAVVSDSKKSQNSVNSKESKFMSSLKVTVQPQRNPHKKKRSDPVFFNFQDALNIHKPVRKPKQHTIFKKKWQHRNTEILSGNYLDSSNPIRNKGKHREIKKKKPTKFKLAIIKERIIKQKMKEKGISAYFSGTQCFQAIESMDFKAEIKEYLVKLNEKKRVKSERKPLNGSLESKRKSERTQEIRTIKAIQEKENLENIVPELKEEKISQNLSGSLTHEGEIKFTSKFREYCDNILTQALNAAVSELIRDLVKLQDRLFARDPINAKKKRRHVSGLREAKKYLTLKKVKLIIIAPNLEKLQMEGAVYDSINELKSLARDQNVPYGFALDRYKLGKCTKKNVPVSAFAVLNYEGIEALFENTLHHLNAAKESFLELATPNIKRVKEGTNDENDKGDIGEKEDINARVISSLISAFREELQLSNKNAQSELD